MNGYVLATALVAAVSVGFLLGVWLRPFLFVRKLPISDVAKFMDAAVNREEAQQQRRANAINLQRSKRRTMRSDGGPPVRVHKKRKRVNKIHRPLDRTP